LALVVFFINGTLQSIYNYLTSAIDYLIVCSDVFYNEPSLKEFVNWKSSQGFSVELVSITSIPNLTVTHPTLLKVRSIENIQPSLTYTKQTIYAFWREGRFLKAYVITVG
jgi:hypothetical protein